MHIAANSPLAEAGCNYRRAARNAPQCSVARGRDGGVREELAKGIEHPLPEGRGGCNSANYIGVVGTDWQTLGFGNFSGRGNDDMIMRNTHTGGLEVYDIDHGRLTGAAYIGAVGLDWQFAGIGPVHGADESDLVLRNATTGQFYVDDISNNALVGAAPLGAVGTDWHVDTVAPNPAAFSGAGGAGGSSLSSQSVNLLTQAMSSFGASGSSGDLGAVAPQETSQHSLLAIPQHA